MFFAMLIGLSQAKSKTINIFEPGMPRLPNGSQVEREENRVQRATSKGGYRAITMIISIKPKNFSKKEIEQCYYVGDPHDHPLYGGTTGKTADQYYDRLAACIFKNVIVKGAETNAPTVHWPSAQALAKTGDSHFGVKFSKANFEAVCERFEEIEGMMPKAESELKKRERAHRFAMQRVEETEKKHQESTDAARQIANEARFHDAAKLEIADFLAFDWSNVDKALEEEGRSWEEHVDAQAKANELLLLLFKTQDECVKARAEYEALES